MQTPAQGVVMAPVSPAVASQQPFTHAPRPPVIPEDYPDQRYFGGLTGGREVEETPHCGTSVTVYRNLRWNTAELRIRVIHDHGQATAEADLTPAKLRDLAQRLLDAAHDIETVPAERAEGGTVLARGTP